MPDELTPQRRTFNFDLAEHLVGAVQDQQYRNNITGHLTTNANPTTPYYTWAVREHDMGIAFNNEIDWGNLDGMEMQDAFKSAIKTCVKAIAERTQNRFEEYRNMYTKALSDLRIEIIELKRELRELHDERNKRTVPLYSRRGELPAHPLGTHPALDAAQNSERPYGTGYWMQP